MTRRHIPRWLSRRLVRDRDGATALEFALVAPLILAFTFGIIELGHLFWTIGALNMAVEDAARCVSVSNVPSPPSTLCDTQTHMQTYAVSRVWGMTVPGSTFTLTTPSCGYLVSASYPYTPIVGYIPMSLTITASACYPVWH
jgi:Flp pilus assembly pilin Flp